MKSYLTGRRGNFFIHEEENRIAGNRFHGPPLLCRPFVAETTFHSCVIMGKINPFIG